MKPTPEQVRLALQVAKRIHREGLVQGVCLGIIIGAGLSTLVTILRHQPWWFQW